MTYLVNCVSGVLQQLLVCQDLGISQVSCGRRLADQWKISISDHNRALRVLRILYVPCVWFEGISEQNDMQ